MLRRWKVFKKLIDVSGTLIKTNIRFNHFANLESEEQHEKGLGADNCVAEGIVL